MSDKKQFPKNFLWGVAYSSHQVEGNNRNNDWWDWEQQGKTKDKSGWACDSWNRYPIDHQLAQDLGCNAFRLSLEWSRIEPEEGKFSEEAIEHYRKVLQDLEKRGMKRVVTLWHWTLPLWFSHDYGWHKKESVEYFTRYCEKVMEKLGDEIDMLITMNEPRLPLNKGYIVGDFPPGKRSPAAFLRARKNMIEAHKKCFGICKKLKKEMPVGITQFCNDFDFFGRSKKLSAITEKIEDFYNWRFFNEIGDAQDFIGVNYYFALKISLKKPFGEMRSHDGIISEMGWGIWPEGLREILCNAWKRYEKPLYVFENGIADKDDKYRKLFLEEHVSWMKKAITRGVDLRGYFHWSLLDNFEWTHGFEKKFGLCEMDYETMERKPRPSYYFYQKIIKNNGLED